MTIILTLEEVLDKCNNWEDFCEKEGWSEYAVNEGGGDITIYLTEEKAYEYGILKKQEYYG